MNNFKLKTFLKEKYGRILFLLLIISSPIIIYSIKFHSLPFSDKTQDWIGFSSYLGGVYSSFFGFASTVILCLTLYFTIRNNNAQLELLKKESAITLFISHVQALNEKLDKRDNKLHFAQAYISSPSNVTEERYIEELQKRYNMNFSIERQNIPEGVPSPFQITFDTLTDFRVRYPQEITSLLNILLMIEIAQDKELKKELIRLFHSLTYRDRTFWIVMYAYHVNEEAKQIIMKNASLIAMADGLSL